jgi:hypothetical protein
VPTGGSPDRAVLRDEEDQRKINVSCTMRSMQIRGVRDRSVDVSSSSMPRKAHSCLTSRGFTIIYDVLKPGFAKARKQLKG